jgi:hypothetical protein
MPFFLWLRLLTGQRLMRLLSNALSGRRAPQRSVCAPRSMDVPVYRSSACKRRKIMWLSSILRFWRSRRRPVRSVRQASPGLYFERLEDRTSPSVTPLNLPQWTQQGPGPIFTGTGVSAAPDNRASGAVESVAVEPIPQTNGTNNYVVYAGTTNGGIWRTDDIKDATFQYTTFRPFLNVPPTWTDPTANPTGIHWRPLTDQMPSLATSAMALDPTDSSGNTLWVGTGDFGSFGGYVGSEASQGLLFTKDGGATWKVMGQAQLGGYRIASVVPTGVQNFITLPGGQILPIGETILVAASDGGGIFHSTNGGTSFQLAFDQDNATAGNPDGTPLKGTATDLVADPYNNHRYFAAMVGGGVAGVYQSNDDGAHWSRIDVGGVPASVISSADMIRLAVHTDSGGTVLFVGVTDNQPSPSTTATLAGIYSATIIPFLSPNWSTLAPPSSPIVFHSKGASELFALAADPTSATTVYVSGQGANLASVIYRGDVSQGPQSWVNLQGTNTNNTQPHNDSRHLMFLNSSTLLETDDGGICALTNPLSAGAQDFHDLWVNLVGDLHNTELFSTTYDTTNNVLLGGTQDNGTPAQTTNPSGWGDLPGGGDGGFVGLALDPTASSALEYLYSADGFGGFNRYNVQSQTSQQIQLASARGAAADSGLDTADQATLSPAPDLPFPFVVSKNDTQQLLLGYNGVYESVESDSSGAIAPGDVINDITPAAMTGVVTSLDYTGAQAVVGTSTGQVFLRTSAPGTWSSLSSFNPPTLTTQPAVSKVLFDPRTTNTVYILYADGEIWRGTVTGRASSNWTELDGSDTNAPGRLSRLSNDIRTLAIYDPGSGNEVLLAGGLGGVYRRFLGNGDANWHQYGQGLPNVVVSDLSYAPSNNGNGDTLVAATFGRGIWTLANASKTLAKPATLQVNDDLGTNNIIDARLDPNNSSFLQVIVNRQVEYDAPYSYFSTISVNANRLQDQVQIEDAPVATQVQVTSGQSGGVTVGKNGVLQGIVGDVHVSDPTDFATFTIDDSADASNHVAVPVTISNSSVTGLSTGTISYDQAGLGILNINVAYNSGQLTNGVFDVVSTPNASSFGSPGQTVTNLTTGGGDTVNVGQFGSTQGIVGNLFINNNALSQTIVKVDDSSDRIAQNQVMVDRYTDPSSNNLYQAIENLAPGNIYLADAEVVAAKVLLGAPRRGSNAVTVLDTVPNDGSTPYLTLEGGNGGGDTLAILGTSTSVLAENFATVTVGNNGLLTGINGDITVNKVTTLTIDDSADTNDRPATSPVTITSTTISGLSQGSITYDPSLLQTLNIHVADSNNSVRTQSTFYVLSTPNFVPAPGQGGGTATYLTTGGGDHVYVGQNGSLQGINGSLFLDNVIQGGSIVVLDDSQDQTAHTTASVEQLGQYDAVFGLAPGQIYLTDGDIQSATINLGTPRVGNNIFTVVSTTPDGPTMILAGGNAGDEADIQGNSSGVTVQNFATVNIGNQGLVQGINGGIAANNDRAVLVDDSTDFIAQTVTVTATTVSGFPGTNTASWLTYSGLNSLAIRAGTPRVNGVPTGVGNTFYVQGTASMPGGTVLHGGFGPDTFNVGSAANTLDPILGPLSIYGKGANTTLNVHDDGTSTTQNWDVANSWIDRYPVGGTRPAVPQISYYNMGTVAVNTGIGQSFIQVESTAAGTNTNVNGNGGGPDQTHVENLQDTLDDVLGPLHVHDVAPSNLFVVDSLSSVGHTYTLSAGQVQRDGIANITYDNMVQLVVATANNPFGHTPNTVTLQSLGNVFAAIEVGTGDRVTVGQNGSMTQVRGDVHIQGLLGQVPKQVTLDDSADGNPRTITGGSDPLFGYLVKGLLPNAYLGRGRIGLALDPTTPVSIESGPSTDLFQVNDLTNAPALSMVGHPLGTTTVQGPNTVNTWQVTGTNAGTLDGTVAFSGVQNLVGGSAGNTFQFHTGGSLAGTLNGGGGTNTLDYTAYQGDILVDLLLHTASLVGQGVSNVANVNGSTGNSLIVGDANANVLVGGTGRNVLIGDGGGDTLTGGGGFNLLIGGITSYDSGPNALQALQALQQYWDNPNATILDSLVNPLRKGVTYNGQFLIFNKTTVRTDNAADTLTGGTGTNAPTWFIEDKDGDTIDHGAGPRPNIDRLLVI